MNADPTAEIDRRFSDPEAGATPWPEVVSALQAAEHLLAEHGPGRRAPARDPVDRGLARRRGALLHQAQREQKARNLETNQHVALTTGNNAWAQGLDVVVEGAAVRVVEHDALQALADAYEAKYGSRWHFEVGDGVFGHADHEAAVFRIEAAKVLAFNNKDPHAQTRYRFASS